MVCGVWDGILGTDLMNDQPQIPQTTLTKEIWEESIRLAGEDRINAIVHHAGMRGAAALAQEVTGKAMKMRGSQIWIGHVIMFGLGLMIGLSR